MMKIQVNGKQTETSATTLAALAEEMGLPEKGVAVAVANQMVQRQEWATTAIRENDSVIIIKAACGG